jgi:DNA polymerase bacteriophage-type
MTNIIIDFETRSRCDLLERGGDNYALDPSTEILCMAAVYADTKFKREWLWFPGDKLDPMFVAQVEKGGLIMAHNAAFDRAIWNSIAVPDHGFPEVEFDRWFCTSAQARVNAMPASLDKLTQALDSRYKKDFRGAALIRKLSMPQKNGTFNEDPILMQQMGDYCLSDVRATKAAVQALRPMTPEEHQDWLVNERINERGIKVDVELAELATNYADMEQEEIARELSELTAGGITKHTQHQKIAGWVHLRLCDTGRKLMERNEGGVKKKSLDKSVRTALLNSESIELIPDVRKLIELVQAGSKSSVSKFKRMIGRADDEDQRVRGAFVYAGASQTLRYASRGLQLHNMRRDCWSVEQTEDLKWQMSEDYVLEDDNGDLPVMDALSKLLRPALIPEKGNVFIVGDWSSIEARALPWLSFGGSEAEAKLELFKQGKDIYVAAAEDIGVDDRQIGKVAELSLGYGGGAGAFNAMAKNYGLSLPDEEVEEIVGAWRTKNSWAVNFWNGLFMSAKAALEYPGQEFKVGRAIYWFEKDLLGGTLCCQLPGDLVIQYPKAKLETVETPYGFKHAITAMKANWTPAADAKEWPRVNLWRGLLAENITQAFCARLLRHVLLTCDRAVGHVHDEIILEVPEHEADGHLEQLRTAMTTEPEWATGLPLAAEPDIMKRYGK